MAMASFLWNCPGVLLSWLIRPPRTQNYYLLLLSPSTSHKEILALESHKQIVTPSSHSYPSVKWIPDLLSLTFVKDQRILSCHLSLFCYSGHAFICSLRMSCALAIQARVQAQGRKPVTCLKVTAGVTRKTLHLSGVNQLERTPQWACSSGF